jgi:hypothetical protein
LHPRSLIPLAESRPPPLRWTHLLRGPTRVSHRQQTTAPRTKSDVRKANEPTTSTVFSQKTRYARRLRRGGSRDRGHADERVHSARLRPATEVRPHHGVRAVLFRYFGSVCFVPSFTCGRDRPRSSDPTVLLRPQRFILLGRGSAFRPSKKTTSISIRTRSSERCRMLG